MSGSVTRKEEAQIAMLKAMNWSAEEIANEVGVSKNTVHDRLTTWESESKEAADWRSVFWRVVLADVFDDSFMGSFAEILIPDDGS